PTIVTHRIEAHAKPPLVGEGQEDRRGLGGAEAVEVEAGDVELQLVPLLEDASMLLEVLRLGEVAGRLLRLAGVQGDGAQGDQAPVPPAPRLVLLVAERVEYGDEFAEEAAGEGIVLIPEVAFRLPDPIVDAGARGDVPPGQDGLVEGGDGPLRDGLQADPRGVETPADGRDVEEAPTLLLPLEEG